jgi:AcrR family transcriptional regulator
MTELELTRRERKKEETKERIFKSAFKLFKAKGFEYTTIDEIAAKADVAKGTFFNYFPRKEAVMGYVPEMWIAEAEEKAAALLSEAGPVGPRMIEMFTEFAEFYEQEPELSGYIITEWNRRMYEGVDEVCQRWKDLGVRVVQHLQSKGEIRADLDARRAYDILDSVYHGTVQRWLSVPEDRFPLKEELRSRLTLVIEGLGQNAKKRQ